MSRHFTYILCSQKKGTLYIGVTRNIARRIYEHQQKLIPGFSSKYNVYILVHVEEFSLMMDAVAREKVLKTWKRQWKIDLIEKHNPEWKDLSKDLWFMNES
jgi:putative endonuclease